MPKLPSLLLLLAAILPLTSCLKVEDADPTTGGDFLLLTTNMLDGQQWALNRPISFVFNHAVDPSTIDFSTIQFRPLENGNPVTGGFTVSEDGFEVTFHPNCGVNESFDDGGLIPDSEYELFVPSITSQNNSFSFLRDSSGKSLRSGTSLQFHTPSYSEPLFQDFVPGPPVVIEPDTLWPSGLNFFTTAQDGKAKVVLTFNQPIDGRSSNLNTNNIYVLYSDDEIGEPGESIYSSSNRVPGYMELLSNCGNNQAIVAFVAVGVLLPNRNLKIVVDAAFRDIAGQSSASDFTSVPFSTTTLANYFPSVLNPASGIAEPFDHRFAVSDEFQEGFLDSSMIDLEVGLPLPMADVGDGFVGASFDFPGEFVSDDDDFYWDSGFTDIFTMSNQIFVDSHNRQFQVNNGVIYVDDFYLAEGSTLRGMGDNPLVIYATGNVVIEGVLTVDGDRGLQPSALNSPQFSEGGAVGKCGGGSGGTASQIIDDYTPRGSNGDGPFGQTGAGGQGGEGCFNQKTGVVSSSTDNTVKHILAAGAGGGTFAMTPNYALHKSDWLFGEGHGPQSVDNGGPDHLPSRHTAWNWQVYGGEDGLRGSAYESAYLGLAPGWNDPRGSFGREDQMPDDTCEDVTDGAPGWDPAWTSGTFPPFLFGHPTLGPDPGSAGNTVFSPDGDGSNDFWGARLKPDGTVSVGELLMPWAGSGGGASGDAQIVVRPDADFDGEKDGPLEDYFPVYPLSSTTIAGNEYYKGAPGGAGGGQIMIFAIGKITLGEFGIVTARGGNGAAGESLNWFYTMISGSGGGSGGHVVLHSSTGLDLSQIDVGTANTEEELSSLTRTESVNAYGGRRGWAGAHFIKVPGTNINDGNATFNVGRGGAGGNGIIQIHVPNPERDIDWPQKAAGAMRSYVNAQGGDPIARAEEMLEYACAPYALCLVPMFSSKSMFMSRWIDTGLAGMRLSESIVDGATGEFQYLDFPAYSDSILAAGLGGDPGVSITANQIVIQTDVVRVPQRFLDDTDLFLADIGLGEHLVYPDSSANGTQIGYTVLSAAFNAGSSQLTLDTDPLDGDMTLTGTGDLDWQVRMSSLVTFDGISAKSGAVLTSGNLTTPLSEVASASTSLLDIQFYNIEIQDASQSLPADYLRNPVLLTGYDFLPDSLGQLSFAVVQSSYNAIADVLSFVTDSADGAPSFALNAANPIWSLRRKFFKIATSGLRDSLPDSVAVYMEFQGAHESFAGSDLPGVPLPSASDWTSKLGELQGCRFLRYRVIFNIDAQETGVDLSSPRSVLDFIKIPIQW